MQVHRLGFSDPRLILAEHRACHREGLDEVVRDLMRRRRQEHAGVPVADFSLQTGPAPLAVFSKKPAVQDETEQVLHLSAPVSWRFPVPIWLILPQVTTPRERCWSSAAGARVPSWSAS